MKRDFKTLKISPSVPFLIVAVLIGGYIRLFQVLQAPLPLGDGGMFYSMTQNLINNGFRLPAVISYNQLNVPNTYPPLGFYLTGWASSLLDLDLLDVFRVLPAIFSILTIPAFFLFARKITRTKSQLIIATLIFSLAPPSFDWLIKGGGITRAPAFLFSLLALTFIYKLYTEEKRFNLPAASFFSALVCLFHPQIALYTACSAIVFFLFLQRNRVGLQKTLIVGGGTLLFSSPWWLAAIIKFGFTPFVNAFTTGEYTFTSLIRYFFGNTFSEIGLTTIGIFGLVGVFFYIYDRNYFITSWAVVSLLIDPRSTPRNLTIVISICAGYALIKLFSMFSRKIGEDGYDHLNIFTGKISGALLIILFCQWVFSAFYTSYTISKTYSLNSDDISAVDWIKQNTNPENHFLVLSGMIPFDDPFSEWLPSLTDRVSLATVQGKEWDTGKDFADAGEEFEAAQACYQKSAECIEDWERNFSENIDYIYIRENNELSDPDEGMYSSAITKALLSSNEYDLAFENDFVAILKKR